MLSLLGNINFVELKLKIVRFFFICKLYLSSKANIGVPYRPVVLLPLSSFFSQDVRKKKKFKKISPARPKRKLSGGPLLAHRPCFGQPCYIEITHFSEMVLFSYAGLSRHHY